MNTLMKNKGILAAVAVFIVAIFLYNSFLKEVEIPSETSAANIGDDLLKINKELQSVYLNQEIFSTPGYSVLVDFSTTIPQQATGRLNPFDVIGRD